MVRVRVKGYRVLAHVLGKCKVRVNGYGYDYGYSQVQGG